MSNNFFIMICSDAEDIDGKKHSAFEVTKNRLNKSLWPIYSGTSNRKKIKSGDMCFFYLAGKMESRQCLIAHAIIRDIKNSSINDISIDPK